MIHNTIIGDKHAIIVWPECRLYFHRFITFLRKKSGERGSLRRFSNVNHSENCFCAGHMQEMSTRRV